MSKRFVKGRDYKTSYRWRFWKRLRKSKSEREYVAYQYMAEHGIPCPKDVEMKDERTALGFLTDSELSMEHVADAEDIRHVCLLDKHADVIADPEFRVQLIDEIAKWVRVMHDNDFYHLNLNFRNMLVKLKPLKPVQVIFIDVTSAKIQPPEYGARFYRMKELAFLYKDARAWFTPKEMVRFLHVYYRCDRLPRERHAYLKKLVEYAQNKWGDRSSTLND